MASALYMDVHIPSSITEGLRRRGIDVLTSQDDGTREAEDETLLARSTKLNRILVTQDEDLLSISSIWQSHGKPFSGVIYAHQLGPGIGKIVEDLELLALCALREELESQVIFLPL